MIERFENFHPFDYAVSIYVTIQILLIIIFGDLSFKHISNILLLSIYLMLVYAIAERWSNSPSKWKLFIRRTYPLFSFVYFYEQTGQFILLIHDRYFDYHIVALERMIFGGSPTVMLQAVSHPILNEIMMLGYVSYFFMIPVIGINFYIKRQFEYLERLVTATCIGFFFSYLFFIFYPVKGPRFILAGEYYMQLDGWIFTPLAAYVINNAGLHGGCMPSSHVAIAVITTLLARRYAPRLFPYYLYFASTLTIGTFWGRFHYVSDAVAGIIVGVVMFKISEAIMNRSFRKRTANQSREG
ncbi:MAG: hypothetical protein GF307_13115 [candidate division Zixibacteria bacterium]|nr:hypothetical protein [candidate division Zixibacteria bacterium]